jgi:branched-chain amino acid transport system substrate-binding protein
VSAWVKLFDPLSNPGISKNSGRFKAVTVCRFALVVVLISLSLAQVASSARAADQIFVPLLTFRTGPFAQSGIGLADGMHDYLTLLNERDGGIGGTRVLVEECETDYDAAKGLACYEKLKNRDPVVISPWSTPITLAILPKASVDKIPILSMASGVSASARGDTFPWAFNPPVTYWDGLSMILSHIGSEVGGISRLRGLRIGYIYIDSGYGREPIPLLGELSKDFGFEHTLYAVSPKDGENQRAIWSKIARDKPDYLIMYGFGPMNQVAVRQALAAKFPMSHFFSIWWIDNDDVRAIGDAANGLRTLNWHNVGQNYPLLQDILTYVVGRGKSLASSDEIGTIYYNHGIYDMMLIAEAIRNAQRLTGKKVVNGADFRRGLETLQISADRLKEIGLDGFAEPISLSCADHNTHRPTYVQQWRNMNWHKISGQVFPLTYKLQPLLDAAAKDFLAKNPTWPSRVEGCDKPS